jgi:hypothetical protein
MNITTEQIENDLLDFFNPFVYIAVQEGETEGGFDIKVINETQLQFIIFDKNWEDDDKQKIWEETYDVSELYSLGAIKSKLAPKIEKSIRIFCGL